MANNEKRQSNNNTPKPAAYSYSGESRTYNDGRGRTAHRTVVRLVKLLDVILVSIPFAVAWMQYYSHQVYAIIFYRKGNWVVIALFVFLY